MRGGDAADITYVLELSLSRPEEQILGENVTILIYIEKNILRGLRLGAKY